MNVLGYTSSYFADVATQGAKDALSSVITPELKEAVQVLAQTAALAAGAGWAIKNASSQIEKADPSEIARARLKRRIEKIKKYLEKQEEDSEAVRSFAESYERAVKRSPDFRISVADAVNDTDKTIFAATDASGLEDIIGKTKIDIHRLQQALRKITFASQARRSDMIKGVWKSLRRLGLYVAVAAAMAAKWPSIWETIPNVKKSLTYLSGGTEEQKEQRKIQQLQDRFERQDRISDAEHELRIEKMRRDKEWLAEYRRIGRGEHNITDFIRSAAYSLYFAVASLVLLYGYAKVGGYLVRFAPYLARMAMRLDSLVATPIEKLAGARVARRDAHLTEALPRPGRHAEVSSDERRGQGAQMGHRARWERAATARYSRRRPEPPEAFVSPGSGDSSP